MYQINDIKDQKVMSIIEDVACDYPAGIDFSIDPYYDEFGIYKSPFSILYCICNRGLAVAPLLDKLFVTFDERVTYLVEVDVVDRIINFTDIDGNNCLHILILNSPSRIKCIQHIMSSGLFRDNRNSCSDTVLDSTLSLYHFIYTRVNGELSYVTQLITYSRLIFILSGYKTLSVSSEYVRRIEDSLTIYMDLMPCIKYTDISK